MSNLTPRVDRFEKNTLINGNFDFWQRATTQTLNSGGGSKIYTADRWAHSNFFASGQFTVSRSTSVPLTSTATYSMSTTINTTISLAGGPSYFFNAGCQRIEGLNMSDAWGKTYTLTFWVKSSLTGLFGVALGSQYDTSNVTNYLTNYTVNSANTWEQKSITVVMPALSAPFTNDTTEGFYIAFPIAAPLHVGTVQNAWVASNSFQVVAATNRTDFLTAGNSIAIAQVSFAEGGSSSSFARAARTYTEELMLCQRYFEKCNFLEEGINQSTNGYYRQQNGANSIWRGSAIYKVSKRALPTVNWWNPVTGTAGTAYVNGSNLPVATVGGSVNQTNWETSGGGANGDAAIAWSVDAEL